MPFRNKAVNQNRPGGSGIADKLCIKCPQREDANTTQLANAVESGDLEEALTTKIIYLSFHTKHP